MTGTVKVTVEVDGQQRDLYELIWIFTATCGCKYGCVVVNPGEELLLTEDQAWAYFQDRKRRRDALRAAGETAELRPRKEVLGLASTCPHTPAWGHDKTPMPEGYELAASWHGRVNHVVSARHSLCGLTDHYSTDDTDERDTCVRCDKLARKLVQP